jgi:transcriptional antiterminator RfaH
MPDDGSRAVDGVSDIGKWYVVHTQPFREKRAATHLGFQGFRTFLPLHRKTVRHARQFRVVDAPFFPRYLFVRFSVEHDRWRSIYGTMGVSRLITANDRPLAVADALVAELLDRATPSGVLTVPAPLTNGQKVRLAVGPFAGLTGTLAALDDRQRVRVLLDLMGTEIAVTTARSGLIPAA